tara:strand:+ start:201 stop:386 length:186 start_codon:yes stop_codon:yes gene_type:complete
MPPITEKITVEPKDPSAKHFRISMIKSVVRIIAGVVLCTGNLLVAGLLLIGAEMLGIWEEL